jgi:hypothetical protein
MERSQRPAPAVRSRITTGRGVASVAAWVRYSVTGWSAQRSATLPEHKAIWAALQLPEPPRFFDFTAISGS